MLAQPYASIHEKLADAIQSISAAIEQKQILGDAPQLLVIARLLTDAQLKLVELSTARRRSTP